MGGFVKDNETLPAGTITARSDSTTYTGPASARFAAAEVNELINRIDAAHGAANDLRTHTSGAVSAASYGAKASASASTNRQAIQDAIDSTGASGDRMLVVQLPEGVINLDAALTLREGVMLRGVGEWKTKLEWNTFAGPAIQFQSGGTYDYPVIVRDLAIHVSGTGIDTGYLSGAHVENVWINAGRGIQVPGTADLIFRNIVFDGGSEGLVFIGGTEANNVLISECHFTGVAFGITVQNVRDLRIVDCAFRGDATHNIHIYSPSSSNTIKDLLVAGNTLYTNASLGVAGSNALKLTGTITGLKVIGNHIEGANGDGFLSDAGTLSGIIASNEFVNVDGDAISVATPGNLSISGNVFASGIGKAALKKRGTGTVTFRGNDIFHANGSGQTGLNGGAVDVDNADLFYARGNVINTAAPTYGFLLRSGVTKWDTSDNYVTGPGIPFGPNNSNTSTVPINGGLQLASHDASPQTARVYVGAAAPTGGTFVVGDRVLNNAPAVGQPKAWACTVAGTPGTWVSEGNL